MTQSKFVHRTYDAKTINECIQESANSGALTTNEVSDGYHTFGELYAHRIALWIAVCKLETRRHKQGTVWRSRRHSDGKPAFGGGWFVLGLGTATGDQITYHLPESYWDACYFATELEKAPEWDGHTSADVLERLKNL